MTFQWLLSKLRSRRYSEFLKSIGISQKLVPTPNVTRWTTYFPTVSEIDYPNEDLTTRARKCGSNGQIETVLPNETWKNLQNGH